MDNTLLAQGLELMIAGMGTVFVFLSVLVVATTAMSALVRRFSAVPATVSETISEDEVAAISAAIARHRRDRTKRKVNE